MTDATFALSLHNLTLHASSIPRPASRRMCVQRELVAQPDAFLVAVSQDPVSELDYQAQLGKFTSKSGGKKSAGSKAAAAAEGEGGAVPMETGDGGAAPDASNG